MELLLLFCRQTGSRSLRLLSASCCCSCAWRGTPRTRGRRGQGDAVDTGTPRTGGRRGDRPSQAGGDLQVLGHQRGGDGVHGCSVSLEPGRRLRPERLQGGHLPADTQQRHSQAPGSKLPTCPRARQDLKSGLVNFILPCSVAICSASGTDSSHLERTHSLSHLRTTANQQQASRKGRSFQPTCCGSPRSGRR